MQIVLSPMCRDGALTLDRQGERPVVSGTSYDFSDLPEGESRLAETLDPDWFAGPVTRRGGRAACAPDPAPCGGCAAGGDLPRGAGRPRGRSHTLTQLNLSRGCAASPGRRGPGR